MIGLASHWPCIIDFIGLSTYGLTAQGKEMSTLPTLFMGYDTLYILPGEWSTRLLLCVPNYTCLLMLVVRR